MSSIEKINYRSDGNSFTLFMRYIENVYEENSDPSYRLFEETETITITFNKDLSIWIVQYSGYEDVHYAPREQAENLPISIQDCEGYGEEY